MRGVPPRQIVPPDPSEMMLLKGLPPLNRILGQPAADLVPRSFRAARRSDMTRRRLAFLLIAAPLALSACASQQGSKQSGATTTFTSDSGALAVGDGVGYVAYRADRSGSDRLVSVPISTE